MDKESMFEINHSFCGSQEYTAAVNKWKVPLEKKRLRRERKKANPHKVSEPDTTVEEKVYVHHPDRGVKLPAHPERIYAVIKVKGEQHKVCKDDRVILESLYSTRSLEEEPPVVLTVGT
jgi:hypothetical protein